MADKRNKDDALLVALAYGAAVEGAARSAGVSPRTAHRRLADPAFQARLQELRSNLVYRSVGMVSAGALEAIRTLLALQAAPTPANIRLGAARSILDISIRLRESAELEQRVAALESQVKRS